MQNIRLAIVGCGTISQLNAPGYLAHPRCEVAALCDPVPERAELRAREWGISPRIYASYDDVLADDRIDAVELLTPTFLHPDQSVAALQAGKHVSCQKPAAGSVADIRRMADAADRASTFYRTTENFLYYPPIVKARELIQEGAIGELGMVRIRTLRGDVRKSPIPFTEGAYEWRQDPDRNLGGMIYDDGWHKVATAIWWGGEVEKVSAIVTRSDDNFLMELPASATWKYAGRDALASIEYAAAPDMPIRTSYYAADEFMEIIGSEGVLWVTRCTGEMLDLPPLVLHRGSETVSFQLPMDWRESFDGAAADFIDAILQDRQPMMDIHFSEAVLRAIIAIYRSSDTAQWVHPSQLSPLPLAGHDIHAGRLIAQAEEELAREDRLQASEKAWGAVAHQLKVIAGLRGWQYERHVDTYDIVRRLVADTGDDEIRLLFSVATNLHRNFYMDLVPISEIRYEIDKVKELLAKLRALETA